MLEFRDVSRVYRKGDREVEALNDISLTVNEGEMAFLVGPSGSGKSTFLNLAGCLDTPTSGTIHLGGSDISSMDAASLSRVRRRLVGFVFQQFNLVPTLTARENVELPMVFADIEPSERSKRARNLLDRVGLSGFAPHRPTELSGGQQQRVAVARALANEPGLLLCDEPTGNLDSDTGATIMDLLRSLNEDGATVLVVTHDTAIIERGCRVIRLRDGEIGAVETRA